MPQTIERPPASDEGARRIIREYVPPAWITHPGARPEFAAEVRAAQHGRPYPTDAVVVC